MASLKGARKIKQPSLRDQVYDQVRKLILSGALTPGVRINLNELSDELGVSKTPLNEAIQKLLKEGLLTVKPRSGTFVSVLDLQEVQESFGFREAIEVGAAAIIVERVTDAEIARLRALLDRMGALLGDNGNPKRYDTFLRLDHQFHEEVVATSGNPLILDHYRQVNTLLQVARLKRRYFHAQYEGTHREHTAILDAMQARDAKALATACRAHLRHGFKKLVEAVPEEDIQKSA